MDAKGLLEQILNAGRELAEQGQSYAEEKLELPPEGPEREAALAKMGKGAAIAGVMGLLLGTKTGRGVTGAGLKLGTLAALGSVAYKAYQNWQGQQAGQSIPSEAPLENLTGPQAEQKSLVLLKAIIAAAKADGHIDPTESAKIEGMVAKLDADGTLAKLIKEELAKTLDPKEIAALADNQSTAVEIYVASLLVIDIDSDQERAYIDQLAQHLNIPKDVALQLETNAKGVA